MKKILLIGILLLTVTLSGFAQSNKIQEKALEKVEELNSQIIAGNKSAALTEVQKEKILELHVLRLTELKTSRQNGGSKEDMKAINQKYFKQIFTDVLTKEQKKARRAGKEDSED